MGKARNLNRCDGLSSYQGLATKQRYAIRVPGVTSQTVTSPRKMVDSCKDEPEDPDMLSGVASSISSSFRLMF